MKKIKLKHNSLSSQSNSYIKEYLLNLGIKEKDIKSFIYAPRPEDEASPFLLDNISVAAQVVYDGLKANKKFFVQVDSDCDGYTSSAILINYIKTRFPNARIEWRLHEGKEHGVIPQTVSEDVDIIIIPDAGSNQFNEHKFLTALGKTVIILDHHEVSDMAELQVTPAIVVNNQTSKNFPNKNLSGAGVVYKFIQTLDLMFYSNNMIYNRYADLAALGIIADAMNMTALDNNFIAHQGLNNVNNKFLYLTAKKQSRGIKNPDNLTKIDIAFYIAPIINGVIRSGAAEDKTMVFRALSEPDCQETFEHTWRGTTTYETLYDCAVRLASNAKSRQDAAVKKSFEWLCEYVHANGLDKHNIIIATLNEKESLKVSPNITGLIATKMVKEFNKPCLVLRTTELNGIECYGGSGRNGSFYNLQDLKSELANAGGLYQEG